MRVIDMHTHIFLRKLRRRLPWPPLNILTFPSPPTTMAP